MALKLIFAIIFSCIIYWLRPAPIQRFKKEYCADLVVDKIYKPEWDEEKHRSLVRVIIKNTGNTMSDSTLVRLREIDVKGYSDEWNTKPSIGSFGQKQKLVKRDSVWLEPVMPKEKKELTLSLNYWVYDPDCELQVEIDTLKGHECEKANNVRQYLEKGKK